MGKPFPAACIGPLAPSFRPGPGPSPVACEVPLPRDTKGLILSEEWP